MNKRVLWLFSILIGLSLPQPVGAQLSLWWVEKKLDLKYDVPNITHERLAAGLASPEASRYLLFDTRERPEYETSHIRSALHVPPDMSTGAFLDKYRTRVRDKHLVFYCSVGDRSSGFAERIREKVLEQGALNVYNLRGGIFRWYNEGHPVVNRKGETDVIHPFDEAWGALINKRVRGETP
jgi:rhodanese-related sulfurtransferase